MARIRDGEARDDAVRGRIISRATLAGPLGDRLPHARALFADASPLGARRPPPPGGARRGARGRRLRRLRSRPSPCPSSLRRPPATGRRHRPALLEAVETRVAAPALGLNCFAANDAALSWYLAHGFEIYGGAMTDLAGKPVVEIHLRRLRGDRTSSAHPPSAI